ncbi:MAG: AIPR family protein [Bryobacteraceae bacterium]
MNHEGRKALFRDHFRDCVEEMLGERFDSLNEVTRSRYMARFFAERVLRPKNPTLLPFAEEEIEGCVVDGKGDQGVDFIAREDGVVLVIQAKYSGMKKQSKRQHEDPDAFEAFRNVLSRLRNYREFDMSESLRETVADIDWENDHFQLYYITLRVLAANQEKIAATGITPLTDLPDLAERSELYLLDETKLNIELRDTLSLDSEESREMKLLFTENQGSPPWIRLADDIGERSCYIGRISGAQLAELFNQHKSCLFNLNIRNYIGDNATNKTIRSTAIESPTEFFFFNNGISALATRIEPDSTDKTGRTLLCQQLSVVNGAQTVRSLHKAHKEDSNALRNVQVLIRITGFHAKKTEEAQEFLDNVTKYNNTQNSIRLSDFRSNDKVQCDLRRRFEGLPSVNGRKFFYRNKRSAERSSHRNPIAMEDFVKTLYAFLYGPDDVYGGTGHVFDATKGGGYAKLFGDGMVILPSLDNGTFEYYAGIWFVCSYGKELWREKVRSSKDSALERRWMFFYSLGEAMRAAYSSRGEDLVPALRALSNPVWTIDVADGPVKKAIGRFARLAFKALSDAYRFSVQKEGFKHRNWFRASATLTLVSEEIQRSWDPLSEHADEYVLPKPK